MGLFNDYRNTNRDSWRFSYLGSQLLPHAIKKCKQFAAKETACREQMAELLKDVNVRASDPRIESLKQDIEKHGCEREKCVVWSHEFERQPDKEYSLQLGDVSYFDLTE